MCSALMVEKASDFRPRHMILKVESEPHMCECVFLFQQRFRERLLNDSAPQRGCQSRERGPRGQRLCAFTSAGAGCLGAGRASCQPPLPHPETGTHTINPHLGLGVMQEHQQLLCCSSAEVWRIPGFISSFCSCTHTRTLKSM